MPTIPNPVKSRFMPVRRTSTNQHSRDNQDPPSHTRSGIFSKAALRTHRSAESTSDVAALQSPTPQNQSQQQLAGAAAGATILENEGLANTSTSVQPQTPQEELVLCLVRRIWNQVRFTSIRYNLGGLTACSSYQRTQAPHSSRLKQTFHPNN
jgi:hypothetical protein